MSQPALEAACFWRGSTNWNTWRPNRPWRCGTFAGAGRAAPAIGHQGLAARI